MAWGFAKALHPATIGPLNQRRAIVADLSALAGVPPNGILGRQARFMNESSP